MHNYGPNCMLMIVKRKQPNYFNLTCVAWSTFACALVCDAEALAAGLGTQRGATVCWCPEHGCMGTDTPRWDQGRRAFEIVERGPTKNHTEFTEAVDMEE